MLKKTILGLTLVALVVALGPSASAACASPRGASTYNSVLLQYVYWHPAANVPLNAPGAVLTGQTWQLGSYATWNDRAQGSSPACTGNLYFNGGGLIGMQLGLNTCGTGCPASGATLAYLAMEAVPGNIPTGFLLETIAEDNSRGLNFDYSQLGARTLGTIPRPRVVSSSRAGSAVNLQVSFDAAVGPVGPDSGAAGTGAAGAITGYKILSHESVGDPGRSASAYEVQAASVLTSAGGPAAATPVSVNCASTTDSHWLVTQLIVENGAVGSDFVSLPTRVSCGPTLADPKFKIVPKGPRDKTSKGNSHPNN
jgi:hypothetical protein